MIFFCRNFSLTYFYLNCSIFVEIPYFKFWVYYRKRVIFFLIINKRIKHTLSVTIWVCLGQILIIKEEPCIFLYRFFFPLYSYLSKEDLNWANHLFRNLQIFLEFDSLRAELLVFRFDLMDVMGYFFIFWGEAEVKFFKLLNVGFKGLYFLILALKNAGYLIFSGKHHQKI